MSELNKDLNLAAQPTGSVARSNYTLNTVAISDVKPENLDSILLNKIDPQREVFYGSPLVLDISAVNNLQDLDFERLKSVCAAHGTFLIGVSGITSEDNHNFLVRRNVPVVNTNRFARIREENFKPRIVTQTLEVKVPVKVPVPYEVKVPVEVKTSVPLKVIARPIHSGETVTALDNSIIIFGSVGSGARIIASHNVIVIGDIRGGEIYAGNPKSTQDPGFTDAFIYASGVFAPSCLAIAGNYQTAEDMEQDPLVKTLIGRDVTVAVRLEGRSLRYFKGKEFLPKNSSKF